MDVYEVNETDPFLIVEVELVSVIEREIQLQLESKDGRATGQACKRNFCTHNNITVNREYFVVKIFSDSQACAKIERAKIHAQY